MTPLKQTLTYWPMTGMSSLESVPCMLTRPSEVAGDEVLSVPSSLTPPSEAAGVEVGSVPSPLTPPSEAATRSSSCAVEGCNSKQQTQIIAE